MSNERSMASDIVDEALKTKAKLFLDQYGSGYVALDGDGNSVCEINSAQCRYWIIDLCTETLDRVPSTATENQVIKVLEAKARRSGERYNLDLNIARYRNAIWHDLGSGAIRISDKSWSYKKNPPIMFRKPDKQQLQVKPKRGGDFKLFLEFINVTNESEQILLLCYVIILFIPGIQYPVLLMHGMQGAGKSLLMQFLKAIVDHSELDTGLNVPKVEEDLALNAYHNYVLFYDNLSDISESLSDALCRAVTGSAFSTRKKYTNSEVFAFKFNRPIILNGINQIVAKSDLLDRSLVMQLERVNENIRLEPGELKEKFSQAKPYLLGAVFDTLVKAQELYNKVDQYKGLSRMTEFDHWGCAIAEALGYGQERFRQARKENIQLQHGYAVEASAVGQAVIAFMQDKSTWSGNPSALYGLLEPIWFRLRLEKPKGAPRLGRELNTLVPNLLAKGILVRTTRGDERIITLTKTTDGTDGNDSR